MPSRTPTSAGRTPPPGTRFLSDVLATNVRDRRVVNGLSQADVVERMNALGHGWKQSTATLVERGERNLTVNELLGLALVFGVTIGDLLDPTGIDGRGTTGLAYDMTGDAGPMSPHPARAWVRGKAAPILWLDDGHVGVTFRPAPDDPVTYSAVVLRGLGITTPSSDSDGKTETDD